MRILPSRSFSLFFSLSRSTLLFAASHRYHHHRRRQQHDMVWVLTDIIFDSVPSPKKEWGTEKFRVSQVTHPSARSALEAELHYYFLQLYYYYYSITIFWE
jgi:hypothetical protein